MTHPVDWRHLEGMTLPQQVRHLRWAVETMTAIPEEWRADLAELTPQQCRVAGILLKRIGHVVPHAALKAAATTPITADPVSPNLVYVVMCHIRPALAKVGVRIDTIREVGYRAVRT